MDKIDLLLKELFRKNLELFAVYGLQNKNLSGELGIDKEQALSLMDTYFKCMPRAKQWVYKLTKRKEKTK